MSTIIRAARLHAYGEPLTIESVELPDPGPGEVLVDMAFGGVNPMDRYMAEGRVAPDAPLPRTLGLEGSGRLDGRPVVVYGGGLGVVRDGMWGQAVIAPLDAVHDVPDGVELLDAASVGVAGLTAWHLVYDVARVTSEDRVLVLGASGGVGGGILSLLGSAGARAWGQTGSPEKVAAIQEGGAEHVVVGGPEALGEALGELQPTVVLDPLGGEFVRPAVEALAFRGRLASFGTSAGPEVQFNLQTLYRKSASILGYGGGGLTPDERRQGLAQTLEALRDGRLKLRIDEVLPLEHVNQAFERLAERRVQGNLVLDLS